MSIASDLLDPYKAIFLGHVFSAVGTSLDNAVGACNLALVRDHQANVPKEGRFPEWWASHRVYSFNDDRSRRFHTCSILSAARTNLHLTLYRRGRQNCS
jgi:hypothetical protein